MNLTKQFFKYVSQNIFGLLGTSCYILADTYFISQAAGTDGVTLLNLCLPIYNFIFAIGSMIGLGAATRYAILRAQGEERAAQRYFSNAVFCASRQAQKTGMLHDDYLKIRSKYKKPAVLIDSYTPKNIARYVNIGLDDEEVI